MDVFLYAFSLMELFHYKLPYGSQNELRKAMHSMGTSDARRELYERKRVERYWYQTSESKSHTLHRNGAIMPVTLETKTVQPECPNVFFKAPISICFSFCKFELSEKLIFL